jgi:signal transduction histidine kinase
MPVYFDLRFRLTALMAVVLCVTVAVLFELNRRAERQIFAQVEQQTEQLTKAVELGIQSISTSDYLDEFIRSRHLSAEQTRNIRRILIVDSTGKITDSTERTERGRRITLPSGMGLVSEGDPMDPTSGNMTRTIVIPFQAAGKNGPELNHVVVVLSSRTLTETVAATSRNRLLATGGALVIALLVAVALVWRFTAPINRLALATRRVATGDLTVRLNLTRKDEIGQLADRFDQMVMQLQEMKELEERLNQAERAAVIGRLASGIAHEIRNPLNFINLTVDHIRKRFAPKEDANRETFERLTLSVKDEIARLNTLVTNVLRFGRPAQITPKKIRLAELIEGVFQVIRAQADEQQVRLHCADETGGVPIEADAELLKSCFSNLAINAVQAMPGGGSLIFRVADGFDHQSVTVSDTGTGIPEDSLEKIFDPYFSTKEAGIGLGLAVTRKIVEDHDGEISVASTRGKGTTFTVRLPKTQPYAAAH